MAKAQKPLKNGGSSGAECLFQEHGDVYQKSVISIADFTQCFCMFEFEASGSQVELHGYICRWSL